MDLHLKNIVIGIGSNVQSIENIRSAVKELRNLSFIEIKKVSRLYQSEAMVPDGAPDGWNSPYLNLALLVRIRLNSVFDLLKELKVIEQKMGRNPYSEKWSPRCIDLDILYVEGVELNSDDLSLPHQGLLIRPFAYLPLMDVLPNHGLQQPAWYQKYLISGDAFFNTRVSDRYVLPILVGILNVTKDSFSDGNKYLTEHEFLSQAKKLIKDGAEILDIGAESARPAAEPISADLEYQRLSFGLRLLQQLKLEGYSFKISIDSYKSTVIQKIINQYDIDMVNCVLGMLDKMTLSCLKDKKIKYVMMHSLSVPVKEGEFLPEDQDPIEIIKSWWDQSLSQAQEIPLDQIIFDPGLGFGKNKFQSRYILQNLDKFQQIRHDFFIGHSRKSFLSYESSRSAKERDLESAIAVQKMNLAYTQYLRVHDVLSTKIALKTTYGL